MLGVPTEDPSKPASLGTGGQATQPDQGETQDNEKKTQLRRNYAVLSRLLYEGSATAMREVFNTIHPPISLQSRLSKAQIAKCLRRLQQQGSLTPDQWRCLYPGHKTTPVSTAFDTKLLRVLLQHICHLTPAYPNGWEGIPLSTDTSLSADLVRLDYIRRSLNNMKGETDGEDLERYANLLIEVLTRIGGPIAKIKSDTIMKEPVSDEDMGHYREQISQWEKYDEKMMKAGSDPISPEFNGSLMARDFTLPQITTSHVVDEAPVVKEEEAGRVGSNQDKVATLTLPGVGVTRSRSNSRAGSGFRTPGTEMLRQDRAILVDHHKLLVENVRSDVVLPRLIMAGLLSHEEKNSINLATRNVDRMKALLRLLPTKPRPAFHAFCEAIKFKYIPIYEQLMKAKKIAMEKPDDITEANVNLKANYKSSMSKTSPISWHPNAHIDVCDFYTPLYITDAQGNEHQPSSILDTKVKPAPGRGRRIMIEGESGSGKTTICRYITAEWAKGDVPISEDYRLVYYIDVKLLKSSLAETILENNHEEGFNKSAQEVYQLVDVYQSEVMFVLDSLEDLSPKVTAEVMELIQGSLFPRSCVVVTLNSMYVTKELMKNFDTKLVVMGLSMDSLEDYVMRYARLTDTAEDLYIDLLEKITGDKESDSDTRILAQNPQLCMCLCLLAESGNSVDIHSMTELLEAFLLAIQKTYCGKNGLKVVGDELPEVVQNLTQDIEEMAWRCMHQNGSFYTYEQAEEENTQADMYAFGFIEKRSSSTLLTLRQEFFSNRVFQDFMAARVLCKLDEEDFMEHVENLVLDKYYCNVTKFLCGLLKCDRTTQRLPSIMSALAKVNLTQWRGYTHQLDTPRTTDESEVILADTGVMEGRLGDFKLSLECLNECSNREDMTNIISESLPTRLFTLNKKTLTHGGILGLAKCIQMGECRISELELRLDHFAQYHGEALFILGRSINESKYMTDMKLQWLDSDLLAEFLAHVFCSPCRITNITCRCHIKTDADNRLSATVWSSMREASDNMSSVETFTFTHSQNKAMVTCILRSLPYTVQHLNITNCALDLVSAQELDMRIAKSSQLNTLDLTGMAIHTVDFNHICAGLKMSESVSDLILANAHLDVMALVSLAECLKFNRSLHHLDLSHNRLPDSGCKSLALALPANRKLKRLTLNSASMTKEGKQVLVERLGNKVIIDGMWSVHFKPSSFTLSKESTVILSQLSPNCKYGLTTEE